MEEIKNNFNIQDIDTVNKCRKKMPEYNDITDLSDFFKILGDSTRLQILMALEHGELCVGDLSFLLGMTVSAISHQLSSLRTAKLVKVRKDGKNAYYSLDDDHIAKLLNLSFEHVNEK